MRSINTYQVKSATGSNLCPMGVTGCQFKIGDKGYKTDFVVCKNLIRPCILGIDFLRKHNIFAGWTAEGKFKLISQQEFLVESLEVLMDGPVIYNKQGITVPGRKLAVIKVSIEMDKTMVAKVVKAQTALTPSNPLSLGEAEGRRKMGFLAKSKSQSLVGKRVIRVRSLMPSDSGLGASPTTGTTMRTLT